MRISHNIKRFRDIVRAFLIDETLEEREKWGRQKLLEFQRHQLSSLVKYAAGNAPFYKELYKNVDMNGQIELEGLPVIGKETMLKNFDRFITDRRIKLDELESHIEQLTEEDEYYLDEYHVLTTSGSSGLRGVFVFNREEWRTVIAGVFRCNRFMDVRPRIPKRVKVSTIGAGNPLHATYRVAKSADVGFYNIQELQATDSVENLIRALNNFQPEVLNSYPSVAALLALEQDKGRLNIQPRVISTHSEVMTEDMRQKIERTWNVTPFNYYGMTEAISLACDCSFHRGLHVFEDLVIMEVVDEDNNPVEDGSSGSKILITNLYNYTQPLIRYEVSDIITTLGGDCPCGRPFRLIAGVEGRSDDILYLPGQQTGEVPVHPLHFRSPMAKFEEVRRYQFIQEEDGIHVRLVLKEGASGEQLENKLKDELKDSLKSVGADPPPIYVHFVDKIEQDLEKMGKLKLIKSNVRE